MAGEETRQRTTEPVVWSDEIETVIDGDLTAAAAYVTPAGGAVVTSVAPCGYHSRVDATVGFTTSLGFPKKLQRILRDPRVAMAFHAREHGFSTSPRYVLVQGLAAVDLTPSRARLDSFVPQATRFLGSTRQGRGWDWLLKEYYYERVFVDVSVTRVWSSGRLDGSGHVEVSGAPLPAPPRSQRPPKRGVEPRVDVSRLEHRTRRLAHHLVAYRGSDGFPVIVPVRMAGYGPGGVHLTAAPGLLPPGGRRAGLLAHTYRNHLVGLTTRSCTGWLSVEEDGRGVFSPHTSKGFVAPPVKNLLLVSNGLMAKLGMWQARRDRRLEDLQRLQADGDGR